MPVVFSNPQFPYQVGPNGSQAFVQQLNFRQMIQEVCLWNADLDPMLAGRFINNAYREVIGKRDWYALKVRGNLSIPTVQTQPGICTVTNGSNIVQGIGTAWASAGPNSVVGLQFRSSFSGPWQTIVSVNNALQQLTIDTPYGLATRTGGFQIQEAYAVLGANITKLAWATNAQQGWPVEVNVPVPVANVWDTWRISLGWTTIFFNRAPTPDGQFQIEMWPTPFQAQVFPFEAYTQPADMVLDQDSPASYIRADLLVTRAVADAKVFSGRGSKYYDPTVAAGKMAEFKSKLEDMENRDNALDQQDVTWDYGFEDGRVGFGPGSFYNQTHD
jgi:hypothetical protein